MTLYHGSDHTVETPVYPGPCARRDFGPGVYTTDSLVLAKEWACGDDQDGIVNTYAWDPTGLQILDLTDPTYSILRWLTVLTQHRCCWMRGAASEQGEAYLQRHYALDLAPYDAIVGYSADDSAFSIARDFLNGSSSLETLNQTMQHAKVQIMLKSENALQRLRFVEAGPAAAEAYYPKWKVRDRAMREAYRRIAQETEDVLHGTYLIDLLREDKRDGDS